MESGKFVIAAQEAEAMAKTAGVATLKELLPLLVPTALRLARPPISNYPVGAVGLGISGRIFLGVNLEFPGLPLNHSVHAEQFLVANAAAHGEAGISYIAVSSVPCGHCRQFLQEIRGAGEIQILATSDEDAAFHPLSSLLPHRFGPFDLLHKGIPLILEPHDNDLGSVESAVIAGGGEEVSKGIEKEGIQQRLRAAAGAAAKASHAPYSGCAAGFAVADGEGRVYAGSYMESAAYNPSLGPMQAAMVGYVAACGGVGREHRGWGILAAALVEKESAAVSQEGTARIFLEAVAPGAHLNVYRFRSSASVHWNPAPPKDDRFLPIARVPVAAFSMASAAPPASLLLRARPRTLSLPHPAAAVARPALDGSESLRRAPRRLFLGIGVSFLDRFARMASGSGGRSFGASARPQRGVSPVSHYPAGYRQDRIVGMGMNEEELMRNPKEVAELMVISTGRVPRTGVWLKLNNIEGLTELWKRWKALVPDKHGI
ncbi:hypothetical protein B296_00027728 [Ensete ventricosum]|uniref:cytidine deaminase n=1 Tax=Ensete ventricosum TaxID=4639 RepID=A0A426ZZ34_ENSVE|nr:hypothetical protein B296_00027728 [Ensete ventricosum]